MKSMYPLEILNFPEIISGNYLYVDKTAWVYQLAHYAKYQFLSRPRRFGKSLFVSTIQAYFEGRKELFKGLAIDSLEKEWISYPVIHIDFSDSKPDSLDSLKATLDYLLATYEKVYHIDVSPIHKETYNIRLINIIKEAYGQTGQKVVVLIDEYDAPMRDMIHDSDLQKEKCEILRNFFCPLKPLDAYLRFVFITGVSKFCQQSICSEFNNLKILTLKDECAMVCGFTENELERYFKGSVENLAQAHHMTYEQVLAKLQTQYGGYHFSATSLGIYNPYSIINAFASEGFNNDWFFSITSTFLMELLRKKGVNMLQLDGLWASPNRFDVPTDRISDPIPVLYQSGYLTIKEYNSDIRQYRLDFPNEEVRQGISEIINHQE